MMSALIVMWISARILADAGTLPDVLPIMLQYGGLGIMLLWFMVRVERRMDAQLKSNREMIDALEENSLSILAAVLAIKNADLSITELAARLKNRIEEARKHAHSGD